MQRAGATSGSAFPGVPVAVLLALGLAALLAVGLWLGPRYANEAAAPSAAPGPATPSAAAAAAPPLADEAPSASSAEPDAIPVAARPTPAADAVSTADAPPPADASLPDEPPPASPAVVAAAERPAPTERAAASGTAAAAPPSSPSAETAPPSVAADGRFPVEVLFLSGSHALLTPQRALVADIQGRWQAAGRPRLRLTCHADCQGNDQDNLVLSMRRCATVAEALARAGIGASALELVPVGESDASCDGTGRSPADRRVVVTLRP